MKSLAVSKVLTEIPMLRPSVRGHWSSRRCQHTSILAVMRTTMWSVGLWKPTPWLAGLTKDTRHRVPILRIFWLWGSDSPDPGRFQYRVQGFEEEASDLATAFDINGLKFARRQGL